MGLGSGQVIIGRKATEVGSAILDLVGRDRASQAEAIPRDGVLQVRAGAGQFGSRWYCFTHPRVEEEGQL